MTGLHFDLPKCLSPRNDTEKISMRRIDMSPLRKDDTHSEMCLRSDATTSHSKVVAEPGCNWEPATPSEDPEVLMMVAEDDSPRAARQRTTSGSTDNGFVFVPDSRTTATGMAATATGMATTATGMAEAATGIAHAADRMPEAFLGERAVWPEWSFVTRGYLVAQGMVTPAELHAIENYPYPVQFAHCNQDQLRRSQQMYYKLTLLLRGKMSRLIQKVEPGSGFEAWRLVVQDMLKLDENQSVGLMNQLLRFHLPSPGCVTDVEQCLARLELSVEALRRQHGELAVPDQMLRAVVIKAMPEPLRGHLQLLGLPTYPELKTAILNYLHARQLWTGLEVSSPTATSSDASMETVEALWRGGKKGKGKGAGKQKLPNEMVCFNCGGVGHPASKCPSPKGVCLSTSSASAALSTTSSISVTCFRCGEKGHVASQCKAVMAPASQAMLFEGPLYTDEEVDAMRAITEI